MTDSRGVVIKDGNNYSIMGNGIEFHHMYHLLRDLTDRAMFKSLSQSINYIY